LHDWDVIAFSAQNRLRGAFKTYVGVQKIEINKNVKNVTG